MWVPHLSLAFLLLLACQAQLGPQFRAWSWGSLPPALGETAMDSGNGSFKLYNSVWHHNDALYAVVDQVTPADELVTELTLNIQLAQLPVGDAKQFYRNLQAGCVVGTTLLLDFPFPAFPDNMGHWVEVLAPVYSVLAEGAWCPGSAAGCSLSALLLVSLRREDLQGLLWVADMIKQALAPALGGSSLPPTLYADDLENLGKGSWLAFQHLLVANDRYVHPEGRGGFSSPAIGQGFRAAAYEAAGVTPQASWALGGAPRTITLLTAVGAEPVSNQDALLGTLRSLGASLGFQVRPYSASTRAPFASFVAAMARTGVLISRHGPLLANAAFLPPGALVLELLPYNWDWKGISQIYTNLTASLGDVHHLAWRATSPRWVQYASPGDARYADWTAQECSSSDCLEAHAKAAMVADSATLVEMLAAMLPGVMRGESVAALRQPWPSAKPLGAGLQ